MKKKSKKVAPCVIVRGRNVGVHFGELIKDRPGVLVLRNARRIWYWKGAASLSELAVYGPKLPAECRFGVVVERQELRGLDTGDYEVIYCQPEGADAIRAVPPWRA